MDKIQKFTEDEKLLDKYHEVIQATIKGSQYLIKKGKGLHYTQPKRNAYKIQQNGQYGGLMINLPKLFGQLQLVATKSGKKGLAQQADFDTIALVTKRFNSKKKYSPLSQMLFDQLNKLSEIPIHRSSKKFSKIGVVYYNNVNDLLERLELLGG